MEHTGLQKIKLINVPKAYKFETQYVCIQKNKLFSSVFE